MLLSDGKAGAVLVDPPRRTQQFQNGHQASNRSAADGQRLSGTRTDAARV